MVMNSKLQFERPISSALTTPRNIKQITNKPLRCSKMLKILKTRQIHQNKFPHFLLLSL